MDIRYQTQDGKWLCFKHAVRRAMDHDQPIIPVMGEDNFRSDYDMRDTSCVDCTDEL